MMDAPLVSLDAIEQAARRIAAVARHTPMLEAPTLTSERLQIRLKCENLQVAGAFKIRGAYNLISRLVADDGVRGVITYSSGNHGQAVAFAARRLGLSAVVVMPVTAPAVKVEGARALGADIILAGTTSLERKARAEEEAERRGLTMVPPFDHPDIIAGQGTVGLEILDDCPGVDRVYVPVGGGGLLAGVAAAIKLRQPRVSVVGVEPAGAAKMRASLEAGHPVTLGSTQSIADGLLPVRPGDLTFAHVRRWVDRVITVDEDAIASAVRRLTTGEKLIVEPSGAVSVAGALREGEGDSRVTVVCVLSGGNIAPDALAALVANVRR